MDNKVKEMKNGVAEEMKTMEVAPDPMAELEMLRAAEQERAAHWQEVRNGEISAVVEMAIKLLDIHGLSLGLKDFGTAHALIVIDKLSGAEYTLAQTAGNDEEVGEPDPAMGKEVDSDISEDEVEKAEVENE